MNLKGSPILGAFRASPLFYIAASTLAFLLTAGFSSKASPARHESLRGAGSDAGASPLLTQDKGKFRILVNGQVAGKEQFEITPAGDDWVARGTTEVQAPQNAATNITGTLRLTANASPLSYEWSTQGAKKASANIQFQGTTATIELRLENARPFTQQFTFNTSRIAILDNNLYHQYVILASLYDWDKKGPQTISVLVPQSMTPGNVTVESLGTQADHNSKLEQLRVRSEDLEVNLFLEGRKLVRINVPSANAEVVRE
jgi:hypothetical protein